jgi:hypothetical protein
LTRPTASSSWTRRRYTSTSWTSPTASKGRGLLVWVRQTS